MKELESQIVSAICDYLSLRKVFFYRQNNFPIWQKDHFRAMPKFTPKGLPDIVVIKNGKYIGLEVKRKGQNLREEQVAIGKLIMKAGGDYFMVRSISDVQEIGL